MAKKYKIRVGFSFILAAGGVLLGGQEIDLEDDVAAAHAHKLELVEPEAPQATAKAPKRAAAQDDAANATQPADVTGEPAAS